MRSSINEELANGVGQPCGLPAACTYFSTPRRWRGGSGPGTGRRAARWIVISQHPSRAPLKVSAYPPQRYDSLRDTDEMDQCKADQAEDHERGGDGAALVVQEAVPLLRSVGTNAGHISDLAEALSRIEGETDDLYDSARSRLYEAKGPTQPIDFWVASKILEHLEKVVDRLEDVANEISGVAVEHA